MLVVDVCRALVYVTCSNVHQSSARVLRAVSFGVRLNSIDEISFEQRTPKLSRGFEDLERTVRRSRETFKRTSKLTPPQTLAELRCTLLACKEELLIEMTFFVGDVSFRSSRRHSRKNLNRDGRFTRQEKTSVAETNVRSIE